MQINEKWETHLLSTKFPFLFTRIAIQLTNLCSIIYWKKHIFNNGTFAAEDATIGAFLFCELMYNLNRSQDLDDEIDDILREFEDKSQRSVLHNVSFY